MLSSLLSRAQTDDLFKKAGIPVLTLDPAALPTLPEMTAEERQANVASSSGATGSGPGVVPTTRVPKVCVFVGTPLRRVWKRSNMSSF